MGVASARRWISPEEYLAGELVADVKHEYVDGEVFAMVGASRRHDRIVVNLILKLAPLAQRRGCAPHTGDIKVRVAAANAYYYPDFVVACDKGDRDEYVIEAPALIVEVLSPSTEAVDRREKRVNYGKIPSLMEYLTVAQDRRRVEVWRRGDEGLRVEAYESGSFRLNSLDGEISLDEIYADVEEG
ncbi:MAG TPA: Uma2 family endonuclease [Azospirillaceae bacterium]|nr:Uma2 family endonuclease [Azospirillaceae bacterium]HRQ81442.1 Uma2 family endonuclease [Azospirillaceae bacterium]